MKKDKDKDKENLDDTSQKDINEEAVEQVEDVIVENPVGSDEVLKAYGKSNQQGNEEVEELNKKLLRLQADYDNFRRRSRTESEQLSLFVKADLIGKVLPVLDNFSRALSVNDNQDAESFRQGMEMIYRQLEKTIYEVGVEKIEAEGSAFDPMVHEAMMNIESPDLPDGQVAMVLEDGFKIKDKVIRPSKVSVVKNS